jgi:hypothetical protein
MYTALLLLISYCIFRIARKTFTSRYVADHMVVGITCIPAEEQHVGGTEFLSV